MVSFSQLALTGFAVLQLVTARKVSHERVKRQATGGDYRTPYWTPIAGSASNLAPRFPFTSTYNGGLAVDPGQTVGTEGFLNVPIPTWGLFDLGGGFRNYQEPLIFGVGVLAAPTNPLDISPQAAVAAAQDPGFRNNRANSRSQPVAVLPGGYSPLSCKPPFCNPFEHSIGVGVEFNEGNEGFDGGLDFPIPLAENGIGTRFPLSGGIGEKVESFKVQWGHHAGAINPFKTKTEKSTRTITETIREPDRQNSRSSGLVLPKIPDRSNSNFGGPRRKSQLRGEGIIRRRLSDFVDRRNSGK